MTVSVQLLPYHGKWHSLLQLLLLTFPCQGWRVLANSTASQPCFSYRVLQAGVSEQTVFFDSVSLLLYSLNRCRLVLAKTSPSFLGQILVDSHIKLWMNLEPQAFLSFLPCIFGTVHQIAPTTWKASPNFRQSSHKVSHELKSWSSMKHKTITITS